MVKGVRIICDGDVGVLKDPKFTAVEVSCEDPVFKDTWIHEDSIAGLIPSCPVSDLSELIGMPFRVRKVAPHLSWKDDAVPGRYTNEEATRLLINLDSCSDSWGYAPAYWQDQIGSVLITPDDFVRGKLISPQGLEALCAYNKFLLPGPSRNVMEQEEEIEGHQSCKSIKICDQVMPKEKQAVENMEVVDQWTPEKEQIRESMKAFDQVTPETYLEFFAEFKSKMEREDPKWLVPANRVLMTSMPNALEPSEYGLGTYCGEVESKPEVEMTDTVGE